MVPFATPQDMADRSQGAITEATHPFLENELAAATRAIRNECGWHIATPELITRRFRRAYWSPIVIPAMEITSASVTTPDGATHVFTDDEFDPDTGWTSWSGDRYTLQFTAGFGDVPEDIRTLTLQIAARALGSPLGVVREQAGGVSVTYSQPGFNVAGGTVLLAHEAASLAAYRLGRVP